MDLALAPTGVPRITCSSNCTTSRLVQDGRSAGGMRTWNRPLLRSCHSTASAKFHDVVDNDVRAVGVNYALTLSAVRLAVITDLAVAINGFGLGPDRRSANHLVKQLHNFSARGGWQAWWYQHPSKDWTAQKENSNEDGWKCKTRAAEMPAPEKGKRVNNDPQEAHPEKQNSGGFPLPTGQIDLSETTSINRDQKRRHDHGRRADTESKTKGRDEQEHNAGQNGQRQCDCNKTNSNASGPRRRRGFSAVFVVGGHNAIQCLRMLCLDGQGQ